MPGGLSEKQTFLFWSHRTKHTVLLTDFQVKLPVAGQGFPGQLACFLERLLCASQSQHFGNDPVWLECLLSVQEAYGPTPSTK